MPKLVHAWRSLIPVALCCSATARAQTTELVSADPQGAVANGDSWRPDASADASLVVWGSKASNLIASDANGVSDVFLRDRVGATTARVSEGPGGAEANGASQLPKISSQGRWIAFMSLASNLGAPDANGTWDVYLVDRSAGSIVRATTAAGGGESDGASFANGFSGDERWMAVSSLATNLVANDTNGVRDLFVRDLAAGGPWVLVSTDAAGNPSDGPTIRSSFSWDGRFIAFESWGSNLVPGDTNGQMDVFVRDLVTGLVTRESVGNGGVESDGISDGPWISGDGRWVGFASYATTFVPGDLNGASEVFVRDRELGLTALVSVPLAGAVPDLDSHLPGISFDGRYVSFNSMASDLVPGDTNGVGDIFVADRATGTIARVSLASGGGQGDGLSIFPIPTRRGDAVVFESSSTTFAPPDANGVRDVFVSSAAPSCEPVTRYCTAKTNSLGCAPAIGFDGWPSVANPGPFTLRASGLLNQKFGLLLYSLSGPAATSFGGGTLCCQGPFRRTAVQGSGGTPPPASDCSGSYAFDFNGHAATGVDPALVLGAAVWAQYWSRDPGFAPPANVGLTDALAFTLCP